VDLSDFDPGYTGGLGKKEVEERLPDLTRRLGELQYLLYADQRYGLLVVLQGLDASGKDSTIRRVFADVGPVGCSVVSFGVPTPEELSHDFLWRYHQRTPARRRVVIFNRSHYEAVLVERVQELVPRETWERRYHHINEFEDLLAAEGTVLMKFLLHISKEEQRRRLQERIDDPRKRWKYNPGDLEDRKRWDDYQAAFGEMLTRCNMPTAPWHVVPADRRWYRDFVILEALIGRLEGLGLRFPDCDPAIEGARVE
jgi:PPK2 family polyphosphate:nucleotide phosphotransferase